MANAGSISGVVVTANGQPWNMASVVAIPPVDGGERAHQSDGSYTINGLTPGQYLLYAHPLPPTRFRRMAPVWPCVVGRERTAFCAVDGLFPNGLYPGTTDLTQATTFTVAADQALTGENFRVQPRSSPPVYDLVTYAWLDPASRTYTYSQPGFGSLPLTPAAASSTAGLRAGQQYADDAHPSSRKPAGDGHRAGLHLSI